MAHETTTGREHRERQQRSQEWWGALESLNTA